MSFGGKSFAPAPTSKKPPIQANQTPTSETAPMVDDPLMEMQSLYGNQAMVSFLGEQGVDEAAEKTAKQPEAVEKIGGQPEPAKDPKKDPTVNPDTESEHVKGAEYTEIKGAPFIQGAKDTTDIQANDVSQGQLGDCYFIASLAALAHTNPELIRNRIKDNGDGTYTVSFNEGGDVIVDGKFPTKGGDVQFAGKGDEDEKKGSELWVMLVEKAWAKIKGGYELIRGSKVRMTSTDAMESFAGGDTLSKNPSTMNDDEMFKVLGEAVDNKWAATIGVKNVTNPDEIKAVKDSGLVPNHAYAILDVDVKNKTITVYNPWGDEYKVPALSADVLRKYVNVMHVNKQTQKK